MLSKYHRKGENEINSWLIFNYIKAPKPQKNGENSQTTSETTIDQNGMF